MKKNKQDQNKSFTQNLGDKVERAGEKLKDMGATRLGNAVYKTGNKIEHSRDEKKNLSKK